MRILASGCEALGACKISQVTKGANRLIGTILVLPEAGGLKTQYI